MQLLSAEYIVQHAIGKSATDQRLYHGHPLITESMCVLCRMPRRCVHALHAHATTTLSSLCRPAACCFQRTCTTRRHTVSQRVCRPQGQHQGLLQCQFCDGWMPTLETIMFCSRGCRLIQPTVYFEVLPCLLHHHKSLYKTEITPHCLSKRIYPSPTSPPICRARTIAGFSNMATRRAAALCALLLVVAVASCCAGNAFHLPRRS